MKIDQRLPTENSRAGAADGLASWVPAAGARSRQEVVDREVADVARPREPAMADVARLRAPTVEDGADIWALVKSTSVLDLNSPYSYLMLGEYFPETCVVAEQRDRLVGFVSAFVPPRRDDAVFVWQVAVANRASGRGLAKAMLRALLERPVCDDVRYLEATVTPSNRRSASLFRGLARDLASPCVVTDGFPSEAFPGAGHEPERRFRIGPLS